MPIGEGLSRGEKICGTSSRLIRATEKSQYSFAPIILGVDPAWTGGDMLAIVMRQGIYSKVLEEIPKNDNDLAGGRKIAHYQDETGAAAIFINMGYGTGIYSVGKDMGRTNWRLVLFAEKPDQPQYANKRAEIWRRGETRTTSRDTAKRGGRARCTK